MNESSYSRIKGWINAILRNHSLYHELDTIENVIVPVLREIGFDVDNYSKVRLVRDCRNNNGSDKHHWDLSLFGGEDSDNPEIVIEAKTASIQFCKKKWTNSNCQWSPKFTNTLAFQVLRLCCGYEAEDIKGRKGNTKVTKADVVRQKDTVLKNLMGANWNEIERCKVDLSRIIRPEGQRAEDVVWEDVSDEMVRCLMNKACVKQYNQTNDWIGQVGRYCLDGKHLFESGKTIPILTNGAEWIVFRKKFYSLTAYPIVRWKKDDSGFEESDVLYYFDVEKSDSLTRLKEIIDAARHELEEQTGR